MILKRELQIEIDHQQRQVDSIQSKLETYNRSRVVTQPVPSLQPQGLTRYTFIILVIFFAAYAGFVAILLAMFSDKVKQRLEEIS